MQPSAIIIARALLHMSRSEEHTSELQSQSNLVCRLLLEKKMPPTCNFNQIVRRIEQSDSTTARGEDLSRFFFNDPATTEIYPLSLHDALPISPSAETLGPIARLLEDGTIRPDVASVY